MISKKNKFNNKKNNIYLAFWFKKIYKTNDNKFYIDRNRFTKYSFSFHKIKIMNKNNSYKNKISYTDLIKVHSYWNIIYILSTSKGILTSKEAYESKIGGFILCKIILLKKKFILKNNLIT
jgi:ribosomal protein S8